MIYKLIPASINENISNIFMAEAYTLLNDIDNLI